MTLKTQTCNKMYWPMWHLFNEISAWSLTSLATGMWGIHSITIRCINDVQWYYCICRMSSYSFCHPITASTWIQSTNPRWALSLQEEALVSWHYSISLRAQRRFRRRTSKLFDAQSRLVFIAKILPGANWSGSGCLCSLGHRPQALQGRRCFVSTSKWEKFLDWNVKGWA